MRRAKIEQMLYDRIVEEFDDFMRGQTVGVYKDKQINYYKWDVDKFMRSFFDGERIMWD